MSSVILMVLIAGGVAISQEKSATPSVTNASTSQVSAGQAIPIETVGDTSHGNELGNLGISWPGEILSQSDVEVYPQREGTITSFNVRIGQWVNAGQALAQLSVPPATPELITMLAEAAEKLATAKSNANAMVTFAAKNKEQILALAKTRTSAPSDTSNPALVALKSAIAQEQLNKQAKQQALRATIEQIFNKQTLLLTNTVTPMTAAYFKLKQGYGAYDQNAQWPFEQAWYELRTALSAQGGSASGGKDADALPTDTMKKYLQAVIKVVNASAPFDPLTWTEITATQKMVADDQNMFFEALKEYQEAGAVLAEKEAEYEKETLESAETTKDIDEQLADLEQKVTMAQGEVKAVEAKYTTIAASINQGLSVVAPRAGIVSTILKRTGEFVMPGVALATINSGNTRDRFVRFRIPGNTTPPKAGALLMVIRPGSPKNGKQAKLTGVGLSLDNNGSYMADASIPDAAAWPVHASVRVLTKETVSATVRVPLAAVTWNEQGQAVLWKVTPEETLYQELVTTGKTLADTIEITKGLAHGEKYVAKITPDLKENLSVKTVPTPTTEPQEPPPTHSLHGGHNE